MRRLLLFILFFGTAGFGLIFSSSGYIRDTYASVCNLADKHFYRIDSKFEDWLAQCRLNSAKVPLFTDNKKLLKLIQEHMDGLQISHFNVYDPQEDKKLWTGESIDSGIRARYVEDHLIIYRVYAGSSADDVGVQAGDEILAIEGTDQVTPWGASTRSGVFTLRRNGKEFKIALVARSFGPDMSPQLSVLRPGVKLLEIPSFRAEFFEREKWIKMVNSFENTHHLIVDIRYNSGGNFVAMLRALSPFFCGEHLAGYLIQPRKTKLANLESLIDDTDDRGQIEVLEVHHKVGLRTFNGYGCYRGKVTVLVGPETSSVSEIFAQQFLSKSGARVWGQPTAGDVVLAVWYELEKMGKGYSISIPQAVYVTARALELENSGVYPVRELYYDLKLSLLGKDSWVEQAQQN